LYNKIINNSGLVFSESIEKVPYGKWMFPKRNRIIAGLCKKLIVIEAPQKSGALITANFASDFSREVFGIPGEIFSLNSVGIHNLIRDDKAKILSNYEDIFEDDQLVFSSLNNTKNIYTKDESEVMKCIMMGNKTIESLVVNLRYDINMLLSILGRLELNNVIEKFEDGSFMVK
jgi:DNA processing protein